MSKVNEDMNTRSVRYPVAVDEKFEKIALKLGRPKRKLFVQMVDYFYRSKKDPLDLNDELLKNTLVKNQQQHIGFIRTQENELLIPIKTGVDVISQHQRKIINAFNEQVLKQNDLQLQNQVLLDNKINTLTRTVGDMYKTLTGKEALKKQFLYILDNYVRSRDTFGLMTSAREKDELVTSAREQVRLL